ncbi:geranyl transferase [Lysobacter sp. TY2-98]|uniref:polyprenyl synthetase family protein n=1 Tax=Lysobacter sp. TY2-98 TaxID=2290922 RepID=UPI000E20A205|nr:farnesyl diphosphate synthase [Lysobacter sp. TY2-98]AXK71564.1 geranyl transferase [Lysobacter sp. TY2-98]
MHDARLDAWRRRIDAALDQALDLPDAPPRLRDAMRHAVLLGGKRMRPLLVLATGALFDADEDALLASAVAVELIHAYSLVHDDLPSMDDDALRRGQPTVHVAFDEATAVLAGDALQSLAFDALAHARADADIAIALVRELAGASGAVGMCGGQALDLDATGRSADVDVAALERLHAMKTGALIRAAVRMGAISGRADAEARAHLDAFADALGLAFQVRDDILDVEADTAQLGKTAGKDLAQDKATFPTLLGLDASRLRLADLTASMSGALDAFGDAAAPLRSLARLAVERAH